MVWRAGKETADGAGGEGTDRHKCLATTIMNYERINHLRLTAGEEVRLKEHQKWEVRAEAN